MEHLQLGNNSFPITFAGLNSLVKYIAISYIEPIGEATEHFDRVNTQNNWELTTTDRTNIFRYFIAQTLNSSFLRHLFRKNRQNQDLCDRVERYLHNKIGNVLRIHDIYAFKPYWLDYLKHVAFTNLVRTYDDGLQFKDNTFEFDGHRFSLYLKRCIRKCDYCGAKYFDQDLLKNYDDCPKSLVPSHLIGYDGNCNSCASNDYSQCDICGCFSDDLEEAVNTGDMVCYDCRRNGNFTHCEQCGDLIDLDDDYTYSSQYGYCFCSENCAEDYGLHWSDSEDDWCDYEEDVDCIVTSYHSHSFRYIGKTRKNQKHRLYIGRETEVDGQNRYDFDKSWYEELISDFDDACVFETDGSLSEGFEIISHPMTEKAFFNMKWEKAFKKLREAGFRSHDTDTCGEHFHFSKWYLGYTFNEQFNSAKKVTAFIELYWDDLVALSRRDDHELSWCRKFGFVPNKNTEMKELSYDHSHRYYAVNLEHLNRHRDECDEDGTIEIRLCKGTLNTNTMLADADFFLHIVRNAKRISWKNIRNLKLWFKGMKKETLEHLKARNAFQGAF